MLLELPYPTYQVPHSKHERVFLDDYTGIPQAAQVSFGVRFTTAIVERGVPSVTCVHAHDPRGSDLLYI